MDLKRYFDVFDADGHDIKDCEVKIKNGCDILDLFIEILIPTRHADTRTKEDMEMDEKNDDGDDEGIGFYGMSEHVHG